MKASTLLLTISVVLLSAFLVRELAAQQEDKPFEASGWEKSTWGRRLPL